ncbi:hypothetical protein B0H14DRAFT_3000372, partial [Mycena olivaceomarginata]
PALRGDGLPSLHGSAPLSLIRCTPSHFLMNAIAVPLVSLSSLRIRASSARPTTIPRQPCCTRFFAHRSLRPLSRGLTLSMLFSVYAIFWILVLSDSCPYIGSPLLL